MRVNNFKANQISFKAIELDPESRKKSDCLLSDLQLAESDAEVSDLKYQLYQVYHPYFKKEAKHRIINSFSSFRPDYVQKLHVTLFDSCGKLKEKESLNTDNLLYLLNKVYPEATEARLHKLEDFQSQAIFDGQKFHLTYEEIIPESNGYTYSSTQNDQEKFEAKQNLKDIISKVSLTDGELKVLNKRSEGGSYNEIATDTSLTASTVRQYVLSAIAKIQQQNNVLPVSYETFANEIKNRYGLKNEVSEIVESLIPFAKYITKDINEVFAQIDDTAELLNISPKIYADMLVRRFELLAFPPATVKNKVIGLSKLLDIPEAKVAVLFQRKPVLITNSTQTFENRLKDVPKILGISEDEFKTMVRKDVSIIAFGAEFLTNRVDNSSEMLNVSRETFIGMCKQMPELMYLKSENLKSKIEKGAEFLGISPEEYTKMCVGRPALLVYTPVTILKKANDIAQLYGITFEECVNLAKSQPVILVKKLETLKRYFEDGPAEYRVSREKFIEAGMKNPAFFVRDPHSMSKKVAIADYYKKVRKQEDGELSFRSSKDEVLYLNILMYLVRKQDNPKLLNAANFVDYINAQDSLKVYCFNIPNDDRVAEDFVDFVSEYSDNNFGKQRFLLHIDENFD